MKFEDYLSEAIEVNHRAYMGSHSKMPRGNGNWMIGLGTSDVDFKNHKEGEHYIQHNGTYGDAVKKAKDAAKKNGKSTVHILP